MLRVLAIQANDLARLDSAMANDHAADAKPRKTSSACTRYQSDNRKRTFELRSTSCAARNEPTTPSCLPSPAPNNGRRYRAAFAMARVWIQYRNGLALGCRGRGQGQVPYRTPCLRLRDHLGSAVTSRPWPTSTEWPRARSLQAWRTRCR